MGLQKWGLAIKYWSQQLELVRRAICIVRIRTTKANALRRAREAMPTPPTSPHDAFASRATQILKLANVRLQDTSAYEGKGTCHACHGKTGKGDGPAGQKLTPKPTDLTNPQALRFKTDAERLQVLKNGISGTGMVALVPIVISEEEAAAVIAYLHTLLGEP